MLQRRNRSNRLSPEINAGSMADIAFLLLIFFLVTSQIGSDRGLLVKLPPIQATANHDDLIEPRNLLGVKVLADGSLTVRDKEIEYEDLKTEISNFVLNPIQSFENASSPSTAVISLDHDGDTPYAYFIKVYNELQSSYTAMRNDLAIKKYGKDFRSINEVEREAIRKAIPIVISEVSK